MFVLIIVKTTKCRSWQVVAHMTEVERLVGVRRRVLNHDERTVLSNWLLTRLRVSVDGPMRRNPQRRKNKKEGGGENA